MAYMMEDIDQKLVKRGKFGPLDIYPQEDKQKEDELSNEFVNRGFKYVIPELLKEYEFHGISKDSNLNSNNPNLDSDVIRILLSVVNKREDTIVNSQIELNKKQQSTQKSQQTFRPNNLLLITTNQKTKEAAYTWFKQLANNESLMKLSKKIPVFNKRVDNLPEILITLYEYQVPISRAVWYLKIIAYSANLNEVKKIKRQQNVDVSSEWTLPLVKFIREIFFRLQYIEQYNYQQAQKSELSSANSSTSQSNNVNPLSNSNLTLESFMNVESLNLILLPVITHSYLTEHKLQCLWNFTHKLIRGMLDENLLDKQMILESMLDLLEKNASGFNSQLHQSSQQHLHQRSTSQLNNNFYSNSKNALAFFEMATIKLLLTSITHNMHHFLQSELLSRRLAYFCSRRLSHMFNEFSQKFFDKAIKQLKTVTQKSNMNGSAAGTVTSSSKDSMNTSIVSNVGPKSTDSSSTQSSNQVVNYVFKKNLPVSSVKIMFDKFVKCPMHRNQIILLTSIIHAIELGCMQALIWNNVGDGKSDSPYNGSPLDYMPCPPSRLLYTYDSSGISPEFRAYVRDELEKAELCIKRRSLAIENSWSIDKLKQPLIGLNNVKILKILDILDQRCYQLTDVNESIDKLYNKIFPRITIFSNWNTMEDGKENDSNELFPEFKNNTSNGKVSSKMDEDSFKGDNEDLDSDESKPLSEKEIIFLLCDWAIAPKRCGLHRIFYALFLIRKRQIDWVTRFKATINARNIPKTETSEGTSDENLKKEESDMDDDLVSRKRKYKLNESDEADVEPGKNQEKMILVKNEPISASKEEGYNRKKMKLNEYDSLDTSSNIKSDTNNEQIISVKSEPGYSTSQKIEMKMKNLSELRPMNMNEKIRKKLEKKKAKRLQLAKVRRQIRLNKQKEQDEKIESGLYEYLFQSILLEYLEKKAPCLDEESAESRQSFTNLVSLFHMFINCKLFSHDRFVCTLISRGETFKNNLNDIKRPIQAIVQGNKAPLNSNSNQNQLQHSQSQQNLKVKNQAQSQKSIDLTSPYQQPASMPQYMPPHTPLQHQKSFSNDNNYNAPLSVPTPSKSSSNMLSQDDTQQPMAGAGNTSYENIPRSVQSASIRMQRSSNHLSNAKAKIHQLKPMSKLALFVLHLPIPQSLHFQHERNQRFVVLYGFGSKKQEILTTLKKTTKKLFRLFTRKSSIDLSDVGPNTKKYYNRITTSNFGVGHSEQEHLNNLSSSYFKLTHNDQYSIIYKLNTFIIDIYKNLDQKQYLPRLQNLQFVFDLMETNTNVFNLITFAIRLLHVGPLIEQYMKNKFLSNTSSRCFFEYLSYFYLNLIGVFRLHLLSLVLWKDLATEVFACLLKLVEDVSRPSKCSSHEKCAFMLLNEMYTNCKYIKTRFAGQFENFAIKIQETEKCFAVAPSVNRLNLNPEKFQMKSDEKLTSMITTTDYSIDEIENYITSKGLYYNFVAHVFVSISNLNKEEMLRVANLCAELSNRNNYFITFWQSASKALYHRNAELTREKTMFNELLNKINIQNSRSRENFKLFLSILAARHCLILNEFIIMVVKTCVMACPGIMADQSHNFALLEPSAWLACHILQYLFTSSPRPLIYRHTTFDQRMLTASFLSHSMTLPFNSFLLVLKGLFLLSDPKKESVVQSRSSNKNSSKSERIAMREKDQATIQIDESSGASSDQIELDQFASNVLQEICEHNWIKERCFNEGDNLLKQNQLLEPALGRRAQNLLHIICYPRSHHLRKQNEQSSTKDFIKNILQNLDIWTLRESLLEFKLMIELQKQKDSYYEYFVECLARTTVDFLIDPEKPSTNAPKKTGNSALVRSKSINSKDNSDDAGSDKNPNSVQDAGSVGTSSGGVPVDSVKSPNIESQDMNVDGDLSNLLAGQAENANDMLELNKMYESDSIYNFDLDKMDQPECDDLEMLKMHKQNQPVGAWLIAPLITKLQDNCQLKVLEHASKTLQDLGKAFWSSKNKIEKENHAMKNLTAWSQQPFFTLLIACLKSKDEQRPLLNSLFNGLSEFVNGKDDKILSEEPRLKLIMLETLHVRLSLVGSMFDFILKNSGDFINWAWLFVQLLFTGVVDPDIDQLLFTMIIDMLFILIHHIITLEPNLDNNKHYQLLIKKISKETKDFSDVPNTKAINHIRRLMPLNKSTCIDIMTVDQNYQVASKTLTTSLDKRKGYKFAKKERISTWDLIEGVKNASALCQSWFGFSKIERKILRYEYQQKLLVRHKHLNIHRELTYFKEKPEVPSDLIEIGQQVVVPTPSTPSLTMNKKEKQTPSNNDMLSLGMNGVGSNSQSSPHLNQSNSAEIVILGSTIPNMNMNSPSSLPPNHQHQQHQLGSHPPQHQSQNPQHSLIMNRLQQQQQHGPNIQPIHGQQQHSQSQQQFHQPSHLQQQQSMPPATNERKNSTNRSLSTPDKKNSGSAKKRNTTPRRNAAANVRGANAISAGNAAASGANQPGMNPQQSLNPAQQLLQQQQQQQMMQQQRSTNSPMLMPQHGQSQQQYHGNPGYNPQNPSQIRPIGPPGSQQQQPHMQPTHQQINQRLQANINQNQTNQGSNYTSNQASGINGSIQANYPNNQMPPKALTPQPGGMNPGNQYPGQMPPRAMPPQQQQQQQRHGYGSGGNQPVTNLNMPQPVKSTTPTLQSQLGSNSQSQPTNQMDARRRAMQQPQQPPAQAIQQKQPLYNNTMNHQQQQQPQQQMPQGNRMMQPQSQQNPYQNPNSVMPKPMGIQQQRTGTPDMTQNKYANNTDASKNIRPQAPYNVSQGPQNPNYPQSQQRMPFQQGQQPINNGTNGQMNWQQQQQQRQNMQRPQQFQSQPQQQQQYMQKQQQSSQPMNMNSNMMQSHMNIQQNQQAQHPMQNQQQPQQQRLYPQAQQQYQQNY